MGKLGGLIDASEAVQRAAVLAEARTWLGTKYHHEADVRGAGVDCALLLVRVWVDLGLVEPFDPRPYPRDWHLHQDGERYMGFLEPLAHALPDNAAPQPGDLAIWRNGRTFSHAAIITEWPVVIHASFPSRCVLEEDVTGTEFETDRRGRPRERRFLSYWKPVE